MGDGQSKTKWHSLVGATLKSLLEPVGIEVRWEVPVITLPPKADLIFIQRKERRTEEQRMLLADGLRDLDVDHILAELKITESLNEKALSWISIYDILYQNTLELKRHQLQSVIISAITPRKEYLERYTFNPIGPPGVYAATPTWGGVIRLILLNELADESHNAPLKCFSSRHKEQKKAFSMIQGEKLYRISDDYCQITAGLWRLIMRGSLHNLEMEGVTPEYVVQLGKEWFASMVDATPDEELFLLPKLEHFVAQKVQDGFRDGRKEEAASMLLKQMCRKFGQTPDWATEKVKAANLELIEIWSDNFVFANSVDEVFASFT